MEEDKKEIEKERNYVGLWVLFFGYPLGLVFSAVFYFSGLYFALGQNPALRIIDETPNFLLLLMALPWSLGGFIFALVGAMRLARKKKNIRPIKIAIASMIDLSMILTGTTFLIGVLFYYTIYPIYYSIPFVGLAAATCVFLLPPIVGVPIVLDLLMPRLWKAVFGYQYGFFEGKLLKNLQSSWNKGDLQKEFRKRLKIAIAIVLLISILLAILAILGFLQ